MQFNTQQHPKIQLKPDPFLTASGKSYIEKAFFQSMKLDIAVQEGKLITSHSGSFS